MFQWHKQVPNNADLISKYTDFQFATQDSKCADYFMQSLSNKVNGNPPIIESVTCKENRIGTITVSISRCNDSLPSFFEKYFKNALFTEFIVTPLASKYDFVYYKHTLDNFQFINKLVMERKVAALSHAEFWWYQKDSRSERLPHAVGIMHFLKPMTINEIDDLLKPSSIQYFTEARNVPSPYEPSHVCFRTMVPNIASGQLSGKVLSWSMVQSPPPSQEEQINKEIILRQETENSTKFPDTTVPVHPESEEVQEEEASNKIEESKESKEPDVSENRENLARWETMMAWIDEGLDLQIRVIMPALLILYVILK